MPSRIEPSLGAPHSFMTAYARSTAELLRTAYDQRRLLRALAKRDLSDDYVAHRLSMGWTLVQPLFLMLVYLFIFTEVYPTRVQAPLGVLLPSGLGLKLDSVDVGRAGFVRCLPNGCVAEVIMDDKLLGQLKSAKTATFIIFETPEEGIGFPLSLNGLAEGFDKLP